MRALFGGSFNPVHNGHLIVARDILEDFSLQEVIFVPAYLQPLKGELSISPEVRLEVLKSAVSLEEKFKVWDYEIRKGGISYTYQTLLKFKELHGERPFFIMGADSFNSFHLWKEPLKILELSTLIVVLRPGFVVKLKEVERALGRSLKTLSVKRGEVELPRELPEVIFYEGRLIEISSTEVRERLKLGLPLSYLLPERALQTLRRFGYAV
ncbi:nicotinate (nicotinamide) nucleotide adenylyltransferase [Thermovibrio sp.]